jgi:hypothetical protein
MQGTMSFKFCNDLLPKEAITSDLTKQIVLVLFDTAYKTIWINTQTSIGKRRAKESSKNMKSLHPSRCKDL